MNITKKMAEVRAQIKAAQIRVKAAGDKFGPFSAQRKAALADFCKLQRQLGELELAELN